MVKTREIWSVIEGMEGQRNSGENAEGKMDKMAFSPQKTHREGEPALLERGTPGFRKDPVPRVLPGGALQEQCSGSAPFIPRTGVGIPSPRNSPAWLGLPRKGWKLFYSPPKNEFCGSCSAGTGQSELQGWGKDPARNFSHFLENQGNSFSCRMAAVLPSHVGVSMLELKSNPSSTSRGHEIFTFQAFKE